jgi:hypothetical protein
MEELKKLIRKNKPDIKQSSIDRYVACLSHLWDDAFKGTGAEFNHKLFFADHERVMKALDKKGLSTRKTMLAAIMSIASGEKETIVKIYRERMLADSESYKKKEAEHKMSDGQKDNWVDWQQVLKSYEDLGKRVAWVWKAEPKKEHLIVLQKYVILSCYVLIPPRRSKDYTDLKWRDYDEKKDNYWDAKGKRLVFNDYKTQKHYGTQTVGAPKPLESIITKWIKLLKKGEVDGPYLFFTESGNKLTSAHMAKLLGGIFGKKVGVNILRHSYITCNLGPKLKELEKVAEEMGHSTEEQKLYRKDKD